jgi:hypothetical protein
MSAPQKLPPAEVGKAATKDKRPTAAEKRRQEAQVRSQFAHSGQAAWVFQMEDAPVFRPTPAELEDPIKYIQSIQLEAAKYGKQRSPDSCVCLSCISLHSCNADQRTLCSPNVC